MEVVFYPLFAYNLPLCLFHSHLPKLPTYHTIFHCRTECLLPSLRDQSKFSCFQLMRESRSSCTSHTCKLFSQYQNKEERLPYSQHSRRTVSNQNTQQVPNPVAFLLCTLPTPPSTTLLPLQGKTKTELRA